MDEDDDYTFELICGHMLRHLFGLDRDQLAQIVFGHFARCMKAQTIREKEGRDDSGGGQAEVEE